MKVLGIDPGSRITGYGLVEKTREGFHLIETGCLKTTGQNFPVRLRQIYCGLRELVAKHRPDAVALEEVFAGKNAQSALKLGQARGAVICAVLACGEVEIFGYAPKLIKQALTGSGSASKEQVRFMVQQLLKIDGALPLDASDALAVAICHLHYGDGA